MHLEIKFRFRSECRLSCNSVRGQRSPCPLDTTLASRLAQGWLIFRELGKSFALLGFRELVSQRPSLNGLVVGKTLSAGWTDRLWPQGFESTKRWCHRRGPLFQAILSQPAELWCQSRDRSAGWYMGTLLAGGPWRSGLEGFESDWERLAPCWSMPMREDGRELLAASWFCTAALLSSGNLHMVFSGLSPI